MLYQATRESTVVKEPTPSISHPTSAIRSAVLLAAYAGRDAGRTPVQWRIDAGRRLHDSRRTPLASAR
jgi:hypothetical protein